MGLFKQRIRRAIYKIGSDSWDLGDHFPVLYAELPLCQRQHERTSDDLTDAEAPVDPLHVVSGGDRIEDDEEHVPEER